MSKYLRPEVYHLRKNVYNFIKNDIFNLIKSGSVLEIGPMQEQWTPVKKYFVDTKIHFENQGINYISCDIDDSGSPDIVCDVLDLKKHVKKNSLEAIIALEVLEHVSEIWKLPEIFSQLLKPSGQIFISTPFYFFRHSPFPDFWRISEDGLGYLFKPYFDVKITGLYTSTDDRKPIHYTMIGTKK